MTQVLPVHARGQEKGDRGAARRGGAVRVFIVDDSHIVRTVFSRLIEAEPGLELAGMARTAEDALAQLGGMHVHVILLDLEMPGMGGMEALPQIIERSGGAKVMIVSTLTVDGASQTVEALALGAADTLDKPQPGGFDGEYKARLLEKIKQIGRRPLLRDARQAAPAPAITTRTIAPDFKARIVAIGASTGGIQATGQLLAALQEPIGAPILITQHLPVEYTDAYARQLSSIAGRQVAIARDGQVLSSNDIILAPGSAHLRVELENRSFVIRLAKGPSANGYIPSVDVMFESLAQCCPKKTLGVVLTGMGRDGAEGAGKLAEAGSYVIVQSEASSVVWGMPGSVARAGLASAQLHPHDLAARVALLTDTSS